MQWLEARSGKAEGVENRTTERGTCSMHISNLADINQLNQRKDNNDCIF
jgi:hypothetical protein